MIGCILSPCILCVRRLSTISGEYRGILLPLSSDPSRPAYNALGFVVLEPHRLHGNVVRISKQAGKLARIT